jgi:RNA polymerase sigma-70 factor (family 1)
MEENYTKAFIGNCEQTDVKALFGTYYTRLVYFAYQILHDKSQAEDVAQDTFVKFWDLCHTVSNHPIAIKNFLYSTAKNACLNVLRHNKVTANHASSNLFETQIEEAVLNNIIRTEVLAEIHAAINMLPASCRQIFRLCYLDGKKNNEVANALGISINTVKTQKQRALKVLRLQLSPELFVLAVAFLIY